MDLATRDALVAQFRRKVYTAASFCSSDGYIPFPHQAEWQLASEGWTLLPQAPVTGEYYTTVLIPEADAFPRDVVLTHRVINGIPSVVVRRAIAPREGGPAHVLADLAAYKGGKSFGTAAWMAGFACLPDVLVQLVGAQYSTAEPEFNYLAEFLLSDRGMHMRAESFLNDKRGGRMRIKLTTGADFEVKSWEQKDALKGKRVTAYVFCEAYQLPGLECFTSVAQNLRELHGYALFPTTPDRPWVTIFHDRGHGLDPDWHCTCDVDARCNPFTYDQKARDRDDPARGGIMTREKFDIAWRGRLGGFVGRVYDFSRGDGGRFFSPLSHPLLWKPAIIDAASADVHAD